MASQDYLIAIALIEQNLVRAMPLGGKEVKDNLEDPENFKKLGEEVVLNLLLRVFQRSDEGALKRASEDKGLILVYVDFHLTCPVVVISKILNFNNIIFKKQ